MFHIWQLFSFRFLGVCKWDHWSVLVSIRFWRPETESHLTRRGRACQTTEMLISWLLQVRIRVWIWISIWISIWIWIRIGICSLLCAWPRSLYDFSSFQFPFEFNQINYVCQCELRLLLVRTLINGHFGLIEWSPINCSKKENKRRLENEADMTILIEKLGLFHILWWLEPVSNELLPHTLSPILIWY